MPPISKSCTALAFLIFLLPVLLPAQETGDVAGIVVARENAQPLVGAQVVTDDGQYGALTNSDGRFQIRGVPAGEHRLQVHMTGYEEGSETVTVVSGEVAEVRFALGVQEFRLNEIVVTGTAGRSLRREQPAEIGEIDASGLVETNPVNSVSNLLQGRNAGVSVTQTSGQSGTGNRIRIRGISSIALSNEPLLYIDGIRVNAANQVARPDDPSRASPATSFDATGGATLSRLDDLNPEDIERVEIVKGPAAATLYGADASAGVIQIITKDGSEGGFDQRLSLEYASIDKNFDPKANWAQCTQDAIDSGAYLCQGEEVGAIVSDNPLVRENIFQRGNSKKVFWSGRGGGEDYGYYLSAALSDEEGTVAINTLDNYRGRVNFNFRPHETVALDAGVGLVLSETNLPMSNHSPLGIPTAGYAGQALAYDGEPGTGWFGGKGRQGLLQIRNDTRVLRNTASFSVDHDPLDWFGHRLVLGGDFTRSERLQFFPRNDENFYLGELDEGLVDENRKSREAVTVDYLGTFSTQFGDEEQWAADFTVGTQWIQQREEFVVATGVGLSNNEARSVAAAAEKTGDQYFQENRSVGYLTQLQLGFRDRLFLQAGARLDQNSSFGADVPTFFLPKVGVSWIVSEESFWDADWVDQLRLRAAFGTTGNAPQGGRDLRTYAPARYVDPLTGGVEPGVVLGNPGNPDLRAERGEEFEIGFDAVLLQNRFDLGVTYFNKVSKDLILQRPIAPSLGFQQSPFDNIGEVVNRGLEVSLGGTVVRSDDLSWRLHTSFNTLHNELRDLGDLEPFGANDARFRVGYPLASVFTHEILRVDEESGRAIVSDSMVFIGPPHADFEGNLQSTMNLFERITISAQADWRTGQIVENGTAAIRDNAFFNSRERIDPDYLSQEEQLRRFGPYFTEDGTAIPSGQVQDVYQEKGDFLRLRELAVSMQLPREWFGWAGIVEGSRLKLAGRNLGLLTSYSGDDPEAVANTATAAFQSYSFFTLPVERRFIASLQFDL